MHTVSNQINKLSEIQKLDYLLKGTDKTLNIVLGE